MYDLHGMEHISSLDFLSCSTVHAEARWHHRNCVAKAVECIAGVEMSLLNVGMKIKPGSGVGAAIEYWADTSKVIPTRAL